MEAVLWCGALETVFFSLVSLANAPRASVMAIVNLFGVISNCMQMSDDVLPDMSSLSALSTSLSKQRSEHIEMFLRTSTGQRFGVYERETLGVLLSAMEDCEMADVRRHFSSVSAGVREKLSAALKTRMRMKIVVAKGGRYD